MKTLGQVVGGIFTLLMALGQIGELIESLSDPRSMGWCLFALVVFGVIVMFHWTAREPQSPTSKEDSIRLPILQKEQESSKTSVHGPWREPLDEAERPAKFQDDFSKTPAPTTIEIGDDWLSLPIFEKEEKSSKTPAYRPWREPLDEAERSARFEKALKEMAQENAARRMKYGQAMREVAQEK